MSFLQMPHPAAARRFFLQRSGVLLSGAAVALLAGNDALAASADEGASDIRILNTALAAELEAIAAYGAGAASGLLQPPVLELARTFQSHHGAHADLLAKTVQKLGGKPVGAQSKYDFQSANLKTQADVLALAAKLERGAVSAYLGAVPMFGDRGLAKAAASILGDEAMHWAVLRQALGQAPVPDAFVA